LRKEAAQQQQQQQQEQPHCQWAQAPSCPYRGVAVRLHCCARFTCEKRRSAAVLQR
jgi:hypothetical protein